MTEHSDIILSRAENTLNRLENISQLPAIPEVLMEISQLFDMPDISV